MKRDGGVEDEDRRGGIESWRVKMERGGRGEDGEGWGGGGVKMDKPAPSARSRRTGMKALTSRISLTGTPAASATRREAATPSGR